MSERPRASDASGRWFGAYGLRLRGLAERLLVAAEPAWPLVELQTQVGRAPGARELLTDTSAVIVLRGSGRIVIDRNPPRARFTVPYELGDAELAHPLLAPVAAIYSRWLGREAFHAGAAVISGEALALVGDREAGKSSLLAWFASHGHPIVCDDVLVTDGTDVFAGPRSVDLRKDAAEHLGTGTGLGLVGARERWRLEVDPIPARQRLAGWMFLDWGATVSVTRLRASERLLRLGHHRSVTLPPTNAGLMLRLAGLPGWELRRPRAWSALPEAAMRVLEELG